MSRTTSSYGVLHSKVDTKFQVAGPEDEDTYIGMMRSFLRTVRDVHLGMRKILKTEAGQPAANQTRLVTKNAQIN